MTRVYINEFDPTAAEWLRELIRAGLLPAADVDDRSILEVSPDDLRNYDQCHFFAGIGGWPLALRMAGWPDDRPVWTGSCPCQPFSVAGSQRGSDDERHLWPAWFRLIRECAPSTVFGEQVAGAAGLAWLDHVLCDMESAGYAAAAAVVPAGAVGAPHRRERLWFVADASQRGFGIDRGAPRQGGHVALSQPACVVADADHDGQHARPGDERGASGARCQNRHDADRRSDLGHAIGPGLEGHRADQAEVGRDGPRRPSSETSPWRDLEWLPCADGKARPAKPGIQPLVDGLPRGMVPSSYHGMAINANRTAEARVARLRGYGNAIVPQVAAEFIGAFLEASPVDGLAG